MLGSLPPDIRTRFGAARINFIAIQQLLSPQITFTIKNLKIGELSSSEEPEKEDQKITSSVPSR